MSNEGLIRRLWEVVGQLETQEVEVRRQAKIMGVPVEKVQTRDGNYLIVPILVARANALCALQALGNPPRKADYARTSE